MKTMHTIQERLCADQQRERRIEELQHAKTEIELTYCYSLRTLR